MFKFESSAIDNISDVQDGQVVVTFNGGRDYTYDVADPANFVSDLQLVIDNEDSVGKFINLAIRGEAPGGAMGAAAAGVFTVGAAAFGVATAPVVVPLAVASAAVSFVASLFDW